MQLSLSISFLHLSIYLSIMLYQNFLFLNFVFVFQIFIWLSSFTSSFLFLVGSLYFVSGSYPHANQFYYTVEKRRTSTLKTTGYKRFLDDETAAPHFAHRRPTFSNYDEEEQAGGKGVVSNPLHMSGASSVSDDRATPIGLVPIKVRKRQGSREYEKRKTSIKFACFLSSFFSKLSCSSSSFFLQ